MVFAEFTCGLAALETSLHSLAWRNTWQELLAPGTLRLCFVVSVKVVWFGKQTTPKSSVRVSRRLLEVPSQPLGTCQKFLISVLVRSAV